MTPNYSYHIFLKNCIQYNFELCGRGITLSVKNAKRTRKVQDRVYGKVSFCFLKFVTGTGADFVNSYCPHGAWVVVDSLVFCTAHATETLFTVENTY